MELSFTNGNDLQQAACRTVAHNLLNFPFDSIPLRITVEFIADPDPSQHNEFAVTDYTYDSIEATIRIASKAPDWLPPYKGVRFLQEVFAHELGHALFAALPQASRAAIAAMFGAGSDDLSELQPSGTPWEDRAIEGIAETFKDAFLPQRYRSFANRTNRLLSIQDYPAFRALWRDSVPALFGGPLDPGEEEVESYDLDIVRSGEPWDEPPFVGVNGYLAGGGGLWSTRLVTFSPPDSSTLVSSLRFEAWIKDGTVLEYSFDLPLSAFGAEVRWQFSKMNFAPGPTSTELFDGRWIKTGGGFTLIGDAIPFGDPPTTVSQRIPIDSSFTRTLRCRGETYRYVHLLTNMVPGSLDGSGLELTLGEFVGDENDEVVHAAARERYLYPWLWEWRFRQTACREGVPGTPVALPSALMVPGEHGGGRVPVRRRVFGQ